MNTEEREVLIKKVESIIGDIPVDSEPGMGGWLCSRDIRMAAEEIVNLIFPLT